jgi:sugar phosphate isomerase/epimerase
MYLTGIADEAAKDIEGQIQATQELGWNAIESRFINGQNIHDISENEFDQVCEALDGSGVFINAFGSAIGNWGKDVRDDFAITEQEIARAIPRMTKLGAKYVRIMSYKVLEQEDQLVEERIRRLRLVVDSFSSAGITTLHENCMNYGGMSWQHTLELVEAVPGMKLVFDTANPAFNRDRSKEGQPWQDPLEFYQNVKEFIEYIHIKDCLNPSAENNHKEVYVYPGQGHGCVKEILTDLHKTGYQGGISIEPHLAAVFHNADSENQTDDDPGEIYIRYGRTLMKLLGEIGYKHQAYNP